MYNKKVLQTAKKNLGKAKQPAKPKDIIYDSRGQWDHPGEVTRIPSNQITMQGVPYPVLAVTDRGQQQMMYPEQEYEFDADYVDEYPQMAKGGSAGCPPGHYYNGKSCVKIPKGTKVITDPKEYEKRKAAYNDSLSLYNHSYLQAKNYFGVNNPDKYAEYNKKDAIEALKRQMETYHSQRNSSDDKDGLILTKIQQKSKIQPIGQRYLGEGHNFIYKKPQQPVVLNKEYNYPTEYDEPIVTPIPPGKIQVGTKEIQSLDPKTGKVKTVIEPVYEDNSMPEKLPLLPPKLIDTTKGKLQGEYVEDNAPEYQMPGYDVERTGIYMRHGNRPTLTIVRKPGMVSKALQKFTGYNPEYSEGYTDEEGNYIPGEFEKAQAEGRRVNFQGASSLRDLKAQKEYNKAYDEYEGKQQFAKALPYLAMGIKQDGGEQDAMNAMMKARLAYANEFGNPAAKRMINIPDNPYQFEDGNTGTHYMASMDNYAVPQIQEENGQLMLGDYDPSSNEAMRFDRPEDAEYFAEHYKDVSPGFIETELSDDEIEEYRKGGYIVEDISVPEINQYAKGGEKKKKKKKETTQEQEPGIVSKTPFQPGTYDPNEMAGSTVNLSAATKSAEAPMWVDFANEYEKKHSRQAFIDAKKRDYLKQNRNLNAMAGVNMDYFPEKVAQNFADEYNYKRNNYVTKKLAKEKGFNPRNRGEWVEQLSPGERKVIEHSRYGSKLQPNLIDRSLVGLAKMASPWSPELQQALAKGEITPGMTKKETREVNKANIKNLPLSKLSHYLPDINLPFAIPTGGLETFSATDIPGAWLANRAKNNAGLSTGANYKEMPIDDSELMPNVSPTDAMALNPLNIIAATELGVGAARLGYKGLKTGYKGLKSTAKAAGKTYNKVATGNNALPITWKVEKPVGSMAEVAEQSIHKLPWDLRHSPTDLGGTSLIKYGDEPHKGNPMFNVYPEDYNVINDETGKLETDPNWKQEGLKDANRSMKGYNFKSYTDPTNQLGDWQFKQFTPGWETQQEMQGLLSHGPQRVVTDTDFHSPSEFNKLLMDQLDYNMARDAFDQAYPENPQDMILSAFSGDRSRDELFSNLYPNVSIPNFRNKFMTPEQEAYVSELLPYNKSVRNRGGLDKNGLKTFTDTWDKPSKDVLPNAYKDLLKKQNNFLSTAPAKDVVMEMRGGLGLKMEDIQKASPEQLEKWRNQIVKKSNKQSIDRWNKEVEKPYKGIDAYQTTTFNASDAEIEAHDLGLDATQLMKKEYESISKTIEDIRADKVHKWQTPEGQRRLQYMIDNTPGLKNAGVTPQSYVEGIVGMTNKNKNYLDKLVELDKINDQLMSIDNDYDLGNIDRTDWMNQTIDLENTLTQKKEDLLKIRNDINYKGSYNAFMSSKKPVDLDKSFKAATKGYDEKGLPIIDWDNFKPIESDLPPDKFLIGVGEANNPFDLKQIIQHEIGHLLQLKGKTVFDNALSKLELKPNDSFSNKLDPFSEPLSKGWDKFKISPEYFSRSKNYFETGSDGQEKLPFALELRQDLLDKNLLKNEYDKITPELLQKHFNMYNKESNAEKTMPLRLYDIMENKKSNFKIISDVLNNAGMLIPGVVGAGLLMDKEKKGGAVNRSKLQKFIS